MRVKINMLYVQCTVYILHIYAHLFILKLCIFPPGPTHFARISKITTRQTRNVRKCCE